MARDSLQATQATPTPRLAAMAMARTPALPPVATLALATAAWFVAVNRMDEMDMGVATELGSFRSFIGTWIAMMAAMMLPGAAPAVARRARIDGPALVAPLFIFSYLAVWTLVGIGIYAIYEPHVTSTAGGLTIAAGLYELTPFKRQLRRRCRASVGSGFEFGRDCVGSSIGLMLMLVGLGLMSITWMAVAGGVIVVQKLVPPIPALDVPVGLAIVGLGALVAFAPEAVPGLTTPM